MHVKDWKDSSVGKDTCHQAWQPILKEPYKIRERGEKTLQIVPSLHRTTTTTQDPHHTHKLKTSKCNKTIFKKSCRRASRYYSQWLGCGKIYPVLSDHLNSKELLKCLFVISAMLGRLLWATESTHGLI